MNHQDTFQPLSGEPADSKLERQINVLDLLFERMPMGIAILDPQFRIRRYNPTWGDFAARYAPANGVPLTPGVGYFEHLPGTEPVVMPLFERALAGEIVQENGIRLESGGITTYWDIVLAPLTEGGVTIGILNVAVDVTEQAQLRRNLEQRVEERTRELQVLLDVTAAANRSLNLKETLEKTLDLIVALVGASRAGVVLIDDDTGELSPFALRPERDVTPDELAKMLSACQSVIASGETLYVAPDSDQGLREPGALLPLQTRGNRLGVLVIIGPQGGAFSPAKLTLFQSIADQLSVAIENARLFKKNEQAAIAAERNRLARDLHDAVTQTLFSSSMIAEVLPRIWARNPEEGRRRLEELRQLTRGALSEMRTLLVELRPAALADTDLGDLIGHQVNAFLARTRIRVEYTRNCAHNPPVEVKEAFYRIAQEAFNNIAKHAEATHVRVELNCDPNQAELTIQDNGIGFDPRSIHHEGLGLEIMAERARNVDAQLEVNSQPRGGARLRVVWLKNDATGASQRARANLR
jgi:signal transduction histidine kinase